MAVIKQNQAQTRACEEIIVALNEVRLLNDAVADANREFELPLGRKSRIRIDPTLNDKMIALLKAQRAKRIKEIQLKADKFDIELDDQDMAVIRGASGSQKPPVRLSDNEFDITPA